MTPVPMCGFGFQSPGAICSNPAAYWWIDAEGEKHPRCRSHGRRIADVLRRHPECGSLEPLATKTKEKATHARTA